MSKKITLPDFDDLFELAENIRVLEEKAGLLEVFIKTKEAEICGIVSTNEKYFINGKPPSQSYIDSTWRYLGLEGELVRYRTDLARIKAELEYKKLRLKLLQLEVEVWRTQSANERSLV